MNTIHNLCLTEKYDDVLIDIFRWKVFDKFVSIALHVSKLAHRMVNNILKLGPLHIAAESRFRSGGFICGYIEDFRESLMRKRSVQIE